VRGQLTVAMLRPAIDCPLSHRGALVIGLLRVAQHDPVHRHRDRGELSLLMAIGRYRAGDRFSAL
jgi:hypothetical protein